METFKIISIIFMMIVIYQIYQINCVVFKEGFEGTSQSIAGVDDTNAINTLAQIAKNLMAGGLTVPGNMNVTGDTKVTGNTNVTGALGVGTTLNVTSNTALGGNLNVTGNTILGGTLTTANDKWNTSTDGKHRIYYGNNSHSFYKTADSHIWRDKDDKDIMTLGNDGILNVSKIKIGGILIENNDGLKINGNLRLDNNKLMMTSSKDNDVFIYMKGPVGGNWLMVDPSGKVYVGSDRMKSGQTINHW